MQKLASEIGATFIETSAKEASNVEQAFQNMASELVKREQGQQIGLTRRQEKRAKAMREEKTKSQDDYPV